jgi:type II secretory pathway component PulF
MPKFTVECVLPKGGGLVRRVVEAPTATTARARLAELGLFPATPVRLADPLTRYKIKRKIFTRLCYEFAENLSGDPKFIDILKLLREHFDHAKTRRILSEIHDAIANGETSPADAFSRYPRSFPPDVIEILRSGFGSGQDALAERFRDLAQRLEDAEARKGQFVAAIAYPAFLIVCVLGLLTYTFTYFLPTFQPLLAAYSAELPAVSEYLFAIGGFTRRYFLVCVGVGIATFFLIGALYKVAPIRFTVDKMILRAPLIGKIMRYLITSEVCSNYRTLF